jgi:hypothetical protein
MANQKFGGRGAKPLRRIRAAYPSWTLSKTGSGHWRFTGPAGQVVIAPSTFTDGPQLKKIMARFRRAEREQA